LPLRPAGPAPLGFFCCSQLPRRSHWTSGLIFFAADSVASSRAIGGMEQPTPSTWPNLGIRERIIASDLVCPLNRLLIRLDLRRLSSNLSQNLIFVILDHVDHIGDS